MSDVEATDFVRALLSEGGPAEDAPPSDDLLAACCLGALFVALTQRVLSGPEWRHKVTEYALTYTRSASHEGSAVPPWHVEGLLRGALGEPPLADGVPVDSRLAIQVSVIHEFRAHAGTGPEREEFVREVVELALGAAEAARASDDPADGN